MTHLKILFFKSSANLKSLYKRHVLMFSPPPLSKPDRNLGFICCQVLVRVHTLRHLTFFLLGKFVKSSQSEFSRHFVKCEHDCLLCSLATMQWQFSTMMYWPQKLLWKSSAEEFDYQFAQPFLLAELIKTTDYVKTVSQVTFLTTFSGHSIPT